MASGSGAGESVDGEQAERPARAAREATNRRRLRRDTGGIDVERSKEESRQALFPYYSRQNPLRPHGRPFPSHGPTKNPGSSRAVNDRTENEAGEMSHQDMDPHFEGNGGQFSLEEIEQSDGAPFFSGTLPAPGIRSLPRVRRRGNLPRPSPIKNGVPEPNSQNSMLDIESPEPQRSENRCAGVPDRFRTRIRLDSYDASTWGTVPCAPKTGPSTRQHYH